VQHRREKLKNVSNSMLVYVCKGMNVLREKMEIKRIFFFMNQ